MWSKLLPGRIFSAFCFAFLLNIIASGQNNDFDAAVRIYIKTYGNLAIKEMMEFRIPASITIAQGIYESNAGRSPLSKDANNHFGIKCHKEWNGMTFIQDDETKNECFRKYNQAEESFRDHSYFLSQRDRYKPLFNLDITDYKGWANGLKACGYATNPHYAENLIKTIEDFELYKLDVADFSLYANDTAVHTPQPEKESVLTNRYDSFAEGPGKRMVYLNNGLQFIILRKGDDIKNVSKAFHVSAHKIRKFNDMRKDAPLVAGQMVYLQQKKKKAIVARHTVRYGETMYTISQCYGIELNQLYRINKLKPGFPLKSGQNILLR